MTALDSTPGKTLPAADVLGRTFAALRTMATRATFRASALLRQPSPTFRLDPRLARDIGLDDVATPRAPFRGDALSNHGLDGDEVVEAMKRDCRRRVP